MFICVRRRRRNHTWDVQKTQIRLNLLTHDINLHVPSQGFYKPNTIVGHCVSLYTDQMSLNNNTTQHWQVMLRNMNLFWVITRSVISWSRCTHSVFKYDIWNRLLEFPRGHKSHALIRLLNPERYDMSRLYNNTLYPFHDIQGHHRNKHISSYC